MAFELKSDAPIGKSLERLSRKTLSKGLDGLTEARVVDAIHTARKSIKKTRAIVALADHAAPRTWAIEKRLRRAAHHLSPLRDARAIAETCARVADRAPARLHPALAAAARSLTAEARRLERDAAEAALFDTIDHELRRARKTMAHAHLDRVDEDGIADALKRAYRRGRRALSTAQERGDADSFHRWRKRVKTLWYQVRLLATRWHTQDAIDALARLEEWLGEDHNVAVLREKLAHMPRLRDRVLRDAIDASCRDYQADLRNRAVAAGRRFYAEPPKAVVRHWRGREPREMHHRAAA
jgi:hypothetical protein